MPGPTTPLDRAIAQADAINPGSSPFQPGAKEALLDIKSLVGTEEKLASLEKRDLSDSTVQAVVKANQQMAIANIDREINNLRYRHPNTGDQSLDQGANEALGNTMSALTKAEASVKALSTNLNPGALQKAVQDIDNAAMNYKFVAAGDLVVASEKAIRSGDANAVGAAYDFVGQGQAADKLFVDLNRDVRTSQYPIDGVRVAMANDYSYAIDRVIGISKSGITGGQTVTDQPSSSSSCPIANICAPAAKGK